MREERKWALQKLRAADAILHMAAEDRPAGYRSALAGPGRGMKEPTPEMVDFALGCVVVIALIDDKGVRMAVTHAAATRHAEPLYTLQEIATMLAVNEKTVRRWLDKGLDHVATRLRLARRHYSERVLHL
jgi:hypothetical protein